jgi:hypothetical protein
MRDNNPEADADWLAKFRSGKLTMEAALAEKFAQGLNLYYEKENAKIRCSKEVFVKMNKDCRSAENGNYP